MKLSQFSLNLSDNPKTHAKARQAFELSSTLTTWKPFRWQIIIKMDLKQEKAVWIHLAQSKKDTNVTFIIFKIPTENTYMHANTLSLALRWSSQSEGKHFNELDVIQNAKLKHKWSGNDVDDKEKKSAPTRSQTHHSPWSLVTVLSYHNSLRHKSKRHLHNST